MDRIRMAETPPPPPTGSSQPHRRKRRSKSPSSKRRVSAVAAALNPRASPQKSTALPPSPQSRRNPNASRIPPEPPLTFGSAGGAGVGGVEPSGNSPVAAGADASGGGLSIEAELREASGLRLRAEALEHRIGVVAMSAEVALAEGLSEHCEDALNVQAGELDAARAALLESDALNGQLREDVLQVRSPSPSP